MDPDEGEARLGVVSQAVKEAWGLPYDVPGHLLRRLVAVAGGGDLLYADAAVTAVDPGVAAGHVCLVTEDLVVLAALSGSKDAAPPDRPTVRVDTWRLAALSGITISDADDAVNGDAEWADSTPGAWPYRSRATLRFDGRTEGLTLPLSPTATDAVRVGLGRLVAALQRAPR